MKRALLVFAVLVVAIPLAVVAAASWFLSGDAVKARLVEQVRRETGRELTIAGRVTLAWSLAPTIVLNDVSLSNPPGFSQPQMAHVARVKAQAALWPLFERRVQIERIAVVAPSVRLEQDAAGRANWDFRPPPTPPAAPSVPSQPRGDRFKVAVGAIDITNATVAWGAQTITAPHVTYEPRTGRVDGTIAASGTALALSGTAGPIADTAYPVSLHLTGGGVTAGLVGTSAAATLTATAPELSALSPLAGRALPPLHDVSISTALPGPSALRVELGKASFGTVMLQHAVLTAASLSDPAVLSATATAGAMPLTIAGHVGSMAALLRGAAPVDARIEMPGLVAAASGTLALDGSGAVQIMLQSPDLGAAGAQAGVALPAFRALAATAGLTLASGRATLDAIRLTSAQGDLSGTLAIDYAARPSLRGTLASTSLDLDALAPPRIPAAAAPAAAPPSPAAAAQAPTPPARAIPDTAMPVTMLREADADLTVAVDALKLRGVMLKAVHAHGVLQNGTLRLDPVSVAVGSATAHATAQVDAAASPPGLHATIDAPGLPFGPAGALFGNPADAPGTLDLRADLSGAGATLRAVAATLTGHAGIAVVDARIDNSVLEHLTGGVLRSANLPLEAAGSTTVRCAALRADAVSGTVQLRALTLDTSKLALDGSGTVNLGDEALDLHLRPQLRLGGGLSVPLRVRGTLAAPKVTLDPGAIASGRVGIVIGGGAPPDSCGPALALARDGQAGAAAPAPAPIRATKPADLLRELLR